MRISRSDINKASDQLLKDAKARFSYMEGVYHEDVQFLSDVALEKVPYQYQQVKETINRMKLHLFSVPFAKDLLVPEAFYTSKLGQLIKYLEAGVFKNDKRIGVSDIMKDTHWSRTYVLKHIYDQNEQLPAELKEGKLPGEKTARGWLILESDYYLWKERYFERKK